MAPNDPAQRTKAGYEARRRIGVGEMELRPCLDEI